MFRHTTSATPNGVVAPKRDYTQEVSASYPEQAGNVREMLCMRVIDLLHLGARRSEDGTRSRSRLTSGNRDTVVALVFRGAGRYEMEVDTLTLALTK